MSARYGWNGRLDWRTLHNMNDTISSQQMQDYERIEQAIQFLEANFREHPSLEQIAASVNLSQYHFQRLFKRWAGISPSQFMQYLTIEYAKAEQPQPAASVLNTALEAGLSGPGRLHDLFVTFTAVSPGEFKQQGAGLVIAYGFPPHPSATARWRKQSAEFVRCGLWLRQKRCCAGGSTTRMAGSQLCGRCRRNGRNGAAHF
ncbi:MAG: AraC family transcriptional regulator [Chloroflexota bacterium]